jgi:hypothetical protein
MNKKKREEEIKVPVVEEQLNVGKRVVERGGVRVTSNVEEHPVEEDVQLKNERITVERRAVDRPLDEAQLGELDKGVLEIRDRVEVPVVEKEARVVEEVIVGKETDERTEKIRDTVRRTNVQVEGLEKERAEGRLYSRDNVDFKEIPRDLTVLENLDDYKVAEREPDIRGWKLISTEGDEIGEVKYLLASPSAQKAFYAIVDTGGWFSGKLLAIPLANLTFDHDDEKVIAPYPTEMFRNAPEYGEDRRDLERCHAYWSKGRAGYARP